MEQIQFYLKCLRGVGGEQIREFYRFPLAASKGYAEGMVDDAIKQNYAEQYAAWRSYVDEHMAELYEAARREE